MSGGPAPITNESAAVGRYCVGIDLGTTNSAVAYVDTTEAAWRVRTFLIPQLVAPGEVSALETLPSFLYQPGAGELGKESLRLPWSGGESEWVAGTLARDYGMLSPGRQISSAKSWLCHGGVDRTADLLPWQSVPEVDRISPVEASARYLMHMRLAWDAAFPEHSLARQDVVLTLPASFDEVARELTVRAAAKAGLPRVVLIEEPQGAFYAWIHRFADRWESLVQPGQTILVCDIGGGTSDFTLIRVRRGRGDEVQFHRVAVGNHLLLGGDNLDLALAHAIEPRLAAGRGGLDARQWQVLVRTCRRVKEALLGDNAPERMTVHVPGQSSKLIGGGLTAEVTREEVRALLIEGFLPKVGLTERPASVRSGFQEFGLPYAPDAAITRYLAQFLASHGESADQGALAGGEGARGEGSGGVARPDLVLFNGGFFASPVLRERLIEVLRSWFTKAEPEWRPTVLEHDRLDLAVARGAAYFGMVRRGKGVRISGGLARTYYIGVAAEGSQGLALCLVPAGVEPGEEVDLTSREFELRYGQPVEFPLYASSVRLNDAAGALVEFDPEAMTALPPIRTVLQTSRRGEAGTVGVRLHARLTEIGTLELWVAEVEGKRTWRLQFDVRAVTQTDLAAHVGRLEGEGFVDESGAERAERVIADTFGPGATAAPDGVMKRLGEVLGENRQGWPASLLRRLWERLLEWEGVRRRSVGHEARWLNLVGFALRPGYGLAADDWRVAETRRVLQGKLVHATPQVLSEWWVLWRRIGAGLTSGQQQALADTLLTGLRTASRALATGKGPARVNVQETAEMFRLLGSLETLPIRLRQEVGQLALDLLASGRGGGLEGALVWTIGRTGSRVPLYGPLNAVVPAELASRWLRKLLERPGSADATLRLAVMQLARKTGDRARDVPDGVREQAARWLAEQPGMEHYVELVRNGGALSEAEQGLVFGESLPAGLRVLVRE